MTPKHQNMLDDMVRKITALYEADANMAMRVIDTATKSAHRLHGRLTVPADAERIEFVQQAGPTVEFSGKLMAENGSDDGKTEFWITLSGDWILLNYYQGRAYIFEGDERTPEDVGAATGYSQWVRPIFKKMGWQARMDFD